MKGVLQPDHIPVNNYELSVPGLPTLMFTSVGGVEEELDAVDLPDRTSVSGGHTKPIEFSGMLPLHHTSEQDAMEGWYSDSQDPVDPEYKKDCTLSLKSISGQVTKRFLLAGVFPYKRKTMDLEMGDEGQMHVIEWSFKGDSCSPM